MLAELVAVRAREWMASHPRVEAVSIGFSGLDPVITLGFNPEATNEERQAAYAHALSFDWSQGVHDQWLRGFVRRQLGNRLDEEKEQMILLRSVVDELLVEMQRIRQQQPARTRNQVYQAIKARAEA